MGKGHLSESVFLEVFHTHTHMCKHTCLCMIVCVCICVYVFWKFYFLSNSGKIACIFLNEEYHCLLTVNKREGVMRDRTYTENFPTSQTARSLRPLSHSYLLIFCSYAAEQWIDPPLLSSSGHFDGEADEQQNAWSSSRPARPMEGQRQEAGVILYPS